MVTIYNLPREVLLQIFKYYLKIESQWQLVRTISRVCRSWSEVCMDDSLWRTIDCTISLPFLKKYCKAGFLKNTESLVFSVCKTNPSKRELELIFKNLPCLKSINCTQISKLFLRRNFVFFSELINHCPSLREIIFCEAQFLIAPTLPLSFTNFLKVRGSNLISIDLSNLCIRSFKELFLTISSTCPNLESLKSQNLDVGRYLFPIQHMQNGLKKLKILRLGFPVLMQNCPSVSACGFPSLHTFTHPSNNDGFINDSQLKKLLMNSSDLKVLDIRGCNILTSDALCSMPAENLERLYVGNTQLCENQGFADVLKKWGHSLIALDVSKIKSKSINNLFELFISSGSLKNLESLELNNTAVKLSTVKLIIQNCPKLNFLQLESCRPLGRGRKHSYNGQIEIKNLLNLLENDYK